MLQKWQRLSIKVNKRLMTWRMRPNYVLDTISLKMQAHALRESKQRTNSANHCVNRQKATTMMVKTQHENSWRQEKFVTWSGRLIFPFTEADITLDQMKKEKSLHAVSVPARTCVGFAHCLCLLYAWSSCNGRWPLEGAQSSCQTDALWISSTQQ